METPSNEKLQLRLIIWYKEKDLMIECEAVTTRWYIS